MLKNLIISREISYRYIKIRISGSILKYNKNRKHKYKTNNRTFYKQTSYGMLNE